MNNKSLSQEVPEGKRMIEMELVEMLGEKRNWHDKRTICSSLSRIRREAKSLAKECKIQQGVGGCESQS